MKLFVALLCIALAGVTSAQTQEYEFDVPTIIAGSPEAAALTIDRDQLLEDLKTLTGDDLAKALKIVKAIIKLDESDYEQTRISLDSASHWVERGIQRRMMELGREIGKWKKVLDEYSSE